MTDQYTFEPCAGENIHNACVKLCECSKNANHAFKMSFNEIELVATPTSDPQDLVNQYQTESNRRHEEYVNSDVYKNRQREAEIAAIAAEKTYNAAMAETKPDFTRTAEQDELWRIGSVANTDPYGNAIIEFASRWARLMESRLDSGEEFTKNLEEKTASIADNEGITGFMFGGAKQILRQTWVHGHKLSVGSW